MSLTDYQKANFRQHTHTTDQLIDPDTGDVADLGGGDYDPAAVAITGGTIVGITDLAVADGGTGASSASAARSNLGLGTIATQAADSVAITGGSITGTSFPGRMILLYSVPNGATFDFTSTSFVNLNTTDFAPSVTVPANGKLLVRLRFTMNGPSQQDCAVALRNASDTLLAEAYCPVIASIQDYAPEFYITGQTPGASLQLRVAAKIAAGTGHLYRATGTYGGGPIIMMAWETL